MEFSLALIQPADLPAVLEQVYALCNDFLALGPNLASPEMVRADYEHARRIGSRFCGIYLPPDGRLVGVLDYLPGGYQDDPAYAYLELLMIAAPFRNNGLGRAVFEGLEAEVRRAGATRLGAGVQVNNPGAVRFWKRCGFRVVSPAHDSGDGTVAFDLLKDLGAPSAGA